jgi:hypothetical protein
VFCCLLHRQCNLSLLPINVLMPLGIGVMVSFIDFSGMKTRCYTNHRICHHNLLRRTKLWRVAQRNPELYIKTELDPIAEDFINDIKVRPGVDASVLKEEHGTLKSHR